MEKLTAQVGDRIKGDEWSWFETLEEDDGFKDSSFPGCQFRVPIPVDETIKLAVNIKVTGGPRWNGVTYQSRCKIECVGDGEPSTFFGGVLYTDRGYN